MEKVLLLGGTGYVGSAMAASLQDCYQVLITSGHEGKPCDYVLDVKDTRKLLEILQKENPDIVISSLRGDFQTQLYFHKILANWMKGRDKRLLYISTANVFDGDQSKAWTEKDTPIAQTDYGKFKIECEEMLQEILGEHLIIFRLSGVWGKDCPRILQMKEFARTGKEIETYSRFLVNVTLVQQIGDYARFVLQQKLTGIFHVGTTDMKDYDVFIRQVADKCGLNQLKYSAEEMQETQYQAILPSRPEIPQNLQMTVAQLITLMVD